MAIKAKTIKHTTINENVKRDKHEINFFQEKNMKSRWGKTILLCTKQKKVSVDRDAMLNLDRGSNPKLLVIGWY